MLIHFRIVSHSFKKKKKFKHWKKWRVPDLKHKMQPNNQTAFNGKGDCFSLNLTIQGPRIKFLNLHTQSKQKPSASLSLTGSDESNCSRSCKRKPQGLKENWHFYFLVYFIKHINRIYKPRVTSQDCGKRGKAFYNQLFGGFFLTVT